MTCSKSNDLEIIRPKLKVPCFSSVTVFYCRDERAGAGVGGNGGGLGGTGAVVGGTGVGVGGYKQESGAREKSVALETGWVRGV